MKLRFSNMYILTILLLVFSVVLSSCGDDDPVGPQVPAGFNATATFYRGVMGSDATVGPEIAFTYGSADKSAIAGSWIVFSLLEGDGSLAFDSIQTDANGKAVCRYTFNGALGHAEIQAMIRNVDTLTVEVRANTLIPGTGGQAQYIVFGDKVSDLIKWNGQPDTVDVPTTVWLVIAVYEDSKGLVFVYNDLDSNEVLSENDSLIQMIVSTIYEGKTKDSIGIGSSVAAFTAVYGGTSPVYDSDPPPAWYYNYDAYGIDIWTDSAQTEIIQIDIDQNGSPPIPLLKEKMSLKSKFRD